MVQADVTNEQFSNFMNKCRPKIGDKTIITEKSNYWDIGQKEADGSEILLNKSLNTKTESIMIASNGNKSYHYEQIMDFAGGRNSNKVTLQKFQLPEDVELLIKQYGKVKENSIAVNYENQVAEVKGKDFTLKAFGEFKISLKLKDNKCKFTFELKGNKTILESSAGQRTLDEDFRYIYESTQVDSVSKDDMMKLDISKITFCDLTNESDECIDEKNLTHLLK